MVPNSDTAIKFLAHIFKDDVKVLAQLYIAQAEDRADVLIKALEEVKGFCDKLIHDIS